MKKTICLLIVVLLVGCATPLGVGAKVQMITFEQIKELDCTRVGFVSAFDTLSLTTGAERRNAMAELLNKLGAGGGNAVVIANQSTTMLGSEINGYAWYCKGLED